MMNTLWQNIRFGFRMLFKNPGFTFVVVLTLALGIGANTAIFSLINTVLLKNLPVNDPEQLVFLKTIGDGNNMAIDFSYPLFQDLREQNQEFSGMFAYNDVKINFSIEDYTERITSELVSGNFFSVLGIKPQYGRLFSVEDDKIPGAHPLAILSYSFWHQRFADDLSIVGKTIHLNNYPFTVIGITPPDFFGVEVGKKPDVWIPMMMQAQLSPGSDRLQKRNSFWVNVMARMKPNGSIQHAQSVTDMLCQQINKEAPGLNENLRDFLLNQHVQLNPASKGLSSLRQQFQQPLLILMGVVGFVLLIACCNVANLMLVRTTVRQKEIAIRLSMGANRTRIIFQLLTECMLLSIFGALFGLFFAIWTFELLSDFIQPDIQTLEFNLDYQILSFNFGCAMFTCFLFGLVPSLKATTPNISSLLKNKIPTHYNRLNHFGFRNTLVVSQISLALLLLIGTGLFVRTLQNLKGVDLGFQADKILLFSLNPGLNGYQDNQVNHFYEQLIDRIGSLPGVQSTSLADQPLLDGAWIDGISVEGFQPSQGQEMVAAAKCVTPKFFETMGITLSTGRDFTIQDKSDSTKVAIINQTFARDFWSDENPIGKRIGIGGEPDCEIIGIIKDTKYRNIKEDIRRTVYIPIAQVNSNSAEHTLHVRTSGNPKYLISVIKHELQLLDKNVPVYNVRTFIELVDGTLIQERLMATISSLFSLLALFLTSIGLYGVISYTATQRTHEIGIRMAIGAQKWDVVQMVIKQGMFLVAIGLVIGLFCTFIFTRFLSSQLYGVTATDPLVISTVTLLLALVALLACYIPARRAANVDPMTALRCE